MKSLSIAAVIMAFGPTMGAQQVAAIADHRYDADLQHSSIEFTARILRIVKVRGRFHDWSATVIYDPANPARSSVTARATMSIR